jgi:zinc protease
MKSLSFILLAGALSAQTVDLTKPPETPPLAAYKLPPVSEATLPNGLRVVTVRDARFPIVTVKLGFQAGSKFDPKEQTGLAETAAALLKEGTKRRNDRQIADEMANLGGALEAVSSADNLQITASALSENTAKLLDLLADVVRNAEFPEAELKLRKQNRAQELMAQRADSATQADEKFQEALFGAHPYSRLLPTEQSHAKIDRAALLNFRKQFLAPNNAVLILVGALPAQGELMKLLEAQFASWPKNATPAAPAPAFPAVKRSLTLVDRPASVQADIKIGRLGIDRTNPDYFPLMVANNILGGGTSSRLFAHFREEKGYAYDVHTEFVPLRNAGSFNVTTQVRNDVIQPAIDDLLAEMKRIGSEPVGTTELTDVKNFIAGNFVLRLETQAGLASQLGMVKLQGLPNDYLETFVTRVRSVEPDQILRAAKKYISPEASAVIVVGDAAKLAKPLEKFGTVTLEKAK